MTIGQGFALELEQESKSTIKLLERLPENKWEWKPHEKSFTIAKLASHIAEILSWVKPTLDEDEFNLNPEEYKPYIAENKNDLISRFDNGLKVTLEGLNSISDEQMMKQWRMLMSGKEVFAQTKLVVVRSMILNHLYHHRAQLGVYLRLNDVAVPQIYGPTADEPGMF